MYKYRLQWELWIHKRTAEADKECGWEKSNARPLHARRGNINVYESPWKDTFSADSAHMEHVNVCHLRRTALSSFTPEKYSSPPARSDPSPWGPATSRSRSRARGATSAWWTCRVSATVWQRCASTAPACSARTARYDLRPSRGESRWCSQGKSTPQVRGANNAQGEIWSRIVEKREKWQWRVREKSERRVRQRGVTEKESVNPWMTRLCKAGTAGGGFLFFSGIFFFFLLDAD